jgi:hypothetical protein
MVLLWLGGKKTDGEEASDVNVVELEKNFWREMKVWLNLS